MAETPIDLSSISHIGLKNNLLSDATYSTILAQLIAKIQSLTNHIDYKVNGSIDLELLLIVCNCCEHLVKKTDGIDKSLLVCEAITTVFNLNEVEQAVLKASINFLCSHGRVKSFSRLYSFLKKALVSVGILSA